MGVIPASTYRTVIDTRSASLPRELHELWRYRELLGFFAWRDIRVRYAQTFIGAAWALIEPFVAVVVFTLLFHGVARFESGSIPYPLFCFAAMVLWTSFNRALTDITRCVVTNAAVVRKIYFPRLTLPLSVVVATAVDLSCALLMYALLAIYFGVLPGVTVVFLPLALALAGLNACGVGLLLAAVNVRFRDISRAIPFIAQTWMFATPVAYPLAVVPADWLPVYALNPMVGVIEFTRWTLLPDYALNPYVVVPSVLFGFALMLLGMRFYIRAQRDFADVI